MRGNKEAGTAASRVNMVVMNDMDGFHFVLGVIDRVAPFGHALPAPIRPSAINASSTNRISPGTARTCRKLETGAGVKRNIEGERVGGYGLSYGIGLEGGQIVKTRKQSRGTYPEAS